MQIHELLNTSKDKIKKTQEDKIYAFQDFKRICKEHDIACFDAVNVDNTFTFISKAYNEGTDHYCLAWCCAQSRIPNVKDTISYIDLPTKEELEEAFVKLVGHEVLRVINSSFFEHKEARVRRVHFDLHSKYI